MRAISRSAIVDLSAERLYAIVEDVASYPGFLPWCVAAEVHERNAGCTLATLSVGIKAMRQSFTTRNTSHPPDAIDIRLVKGPFRHFEARWTFVSLGDSASKIEFRMAYEFSSAAVAAMLGPLFQHIADTMVEAFIRRAGEIHGRTEG